MERELNSEVWLEGSSNFYISIQLQIRIVLFHFTGLFFCFWLYRMVCRILVPLTRDWTWAWAQGSPNHWTTRELPLVSFCYSFLFIFTTCSLITKGPSTSKTVVISSLQVTYSYSHSESHLFLFIIYFLLNSKTIHKIKSPETLTI